MQDSQLYSTPDYTSAQNTTEFTLWENGTADCPVISSRHPFRNKYTKVCMDR